jgi:hypothetical protein
VSSRAWGIRANPVHLLIEVSCRVQGTEDRTTLDSIPKAAAATLREQARGMTITKVDRETEDRQDVFEAWFANGVRAVRSEGDGVLELEVEAMKRSRRTSPTAASSPWSR